MKDIYLGMKLDIGSGNPSEGENQAGNDYILQDAETHPGITIVCDIRDLNKHIKPNFCSEIRASHVLEHFHAKELKSSILPMLKDLLQEGGILNIIVPNFEYHCEVLKAGDDENAINMAYGGGLDKYDHHYTGWTPRLAVKWLTDAGFEIVDFKVDTCVHVKAKKI